MAQATQAAGAPVAVERYRRKRSPIGKVGHFLFAYPVIPGFILGMLLIVGTFGNFMYPRDPIKQVLPLKNFPPTYGRTTDNLSLPVDDRERFTRK